MPYFPTKVVKEILGALDKLDPIFFFGGNGDVLGAAVVIDLVHIRP